MMDLYHRLLRILHLTWLIIRNPRKTIQETESTGFVSRGFGYALNWKHTGIENVSMDSPNPLKTYFDNHTHGNGIWKWEHYFEIYHQYFKKFIGKEVHIVEVGVYSGGSLGMWRHYFGDKCRVYGVDIEESCKNYESKGIEIFIGDQSDRNFWRHFRERVPKIDIFIDDGGHQPDQQIATLEEVLPAIGPGGIYLCEDIHGSANHFADYIHGLCKSLHHKNFNYGDILSSRRNAFQRNIWAVHNYPFAVVIEKSNSNEPDYLSPKHGTKWEPHL